MTDTDSIRKGYSWTPRERPREYTESREDEFDRWHAEEIRKAKEEAWEEGHSDCIKSKVQRDGYRRDNPYKKKDAS